MAERSRMPPARPPAARSALTRVATLGGIGYTPVMPGTAGSLVGAATCFPLLGLDWRLYLVCVLLVSLGGVYTSTQVARGLGEADPPWIVIDELAGMWTAAIGLPASLYELAAVFLLFRLFDVVKPAPIPRLERLPGGLGIVADDLAAGLLAAATWWLLKANFDFL
ncbi:MAG TPA: phosphatidylglycerophosphatase A [Candidatus Sulfotelmatobacter sp.]|nr:phosphatidylglycerophosphatase A [Candidatus Sulfotelmatobacter sp.]